MVESLGEAEANLLRAKLQAFLSRNPEADVRVRGHEPSVLVTSGVKKPSKSLCAVTMTN